MLLSVSARDEALTTTAIALERRGAEDEDQEKQAQKEGEDPRPQGKSALGIPGFRAPLLLSRERSIEQPFWKSVALNFEGPRKAPRRQQME